MASDMVFDEKISSVMSLSKVFDCLMCEKESPRTILDFLYMYKERAYDILLFSDTSPRLFSPDFVHKCSPVEVNVFADMCVSIMRDIEKNGLSSRLLNISKLFWIVRVGSREDFSSTVKNIFTSCLYQKYRYDCLGYSPYSGILGNEYLDFDKLFFKAEKPCDYAVVINKMPIETLAKFAKNCERSSLVAQRILQEDVFACIDDVKKFVFLKHGAPFTTTDYKKGLKQLACGSLDPEMRKYVCEIIHRSGPSFLVSDFIGNTFLANACVSLEDEAFKAKSFNEIAIRLEIGGGDRSCDWIVYDLLARYGLDYIGKGAKAHRAFLERNFDITDIFD